MSVPWADPLRRRIGGRRTLRRRVGRLAALGVLIALLQLAAQVVAGTRAQSSGAAATRLVVLQAAAGDLRAAVEEQRASLLLYQRTGEVEFMGEFALGRATAERQLRVLGTGLAGSPAERQVARVQSDVQTWQRWADGAQVMGDAVDVDEGERLFDRTEISQAELAGIVARAASEATWTAGRAGLVAFATSLAGSVAVVAVLVLLVVHIVRLAVLPIPRLAATARRIARGEPAPIDATGPEEIRDLARALGAWQEASAERELVAQQAPVGIVRVDSAGRVVSANKAAEAMHQRFGDDLVGRPMSELIHTDDLPVAIATMEDVHGGRVPSATIEVRGLRADGTLVWFSIAVGRLLKADGEPAGTVAVLEDVTERKRQAERAARIQRELWPRTPPRLHGYEVAGECRAAQEVAGDLYDWALTEDGHLELTLADVMGKGIGAALVMAELRTALRAAPPGLGPARKLALAASSMTLGMDEDGTFVTVFHARLEPATGRLRYVDAGHGYCVVRRASGEVTPLGERSLPLGVLAGEAFREGATCLEPGDTLVVYSDGVVETGGAAPHRWPLDGELARAGSADEVVRRLLGRVSQRLPDDATALAVRRLPAG